MSGMAKDNRRRLEVLYNLHKKIWSVRYRGKVLEHTTNIELEDVSLDVQPAGNARVRREKRKNVHAFVRGKRVEPWKVSYDKNWKEVTYNPYKHKNFVLDNDHSAIVTGGILAHIDSTGVYVLEPTLRFENLLEV